MNKVLFFLLSITLLISCSSKDTIPIYDYYKNIPVLRGWTSDEEQKNYMIEIVLVYRENNTDLQTNINNLKPVLIDSLRGYLSSLKEEDFVAENQPYLKKEAVKILNNTILESMKPKDADKIRAKETLEEMDLLLDINIMQLQVFSLY